MTSPIQYMHGESFVYPVVTTSCSEEIVQNSVEFKQAYIALQSQDQQVLLVLLQNHRLPSSQLPLGFAGSHLWQTARTPVQRQRWHSPSCRKEISQALLQRKGVPKLFTQRCFKSRWWQSCIYAAGMCILCRLASYLRIKMSTEPINCHDRKKSQSGKLSKFETPVMTPWCNLSALEENVRWKCLTALKQASKCSGFGVQAALSRCAGYRPATGQQTRAKGAGVTSRVKQEEGVGQAVMLAWLLCKVSFQIIYPSFFAWHQGQGLTWNLPNVVR